MHRRPVYIYLLSVPLFQQNKTNVSFREIARLSLEILGIQLVAVTVRGALCLTWSSDLNNIYIIQ